VILPLVSTFIPVPGREWQAGAEHKYAIAVSTVPLSSEYERFHVSDLFIDPDPEAFGICNIVLISETPTLVTKKQEQEIFNAGSAGYVSAATFSTQRQSHPDIVWPILFGGRDRLVVKMINLDGRARRVMGCFVGRPSRSPS